MSLIRQYFLNATPTCVFFKMSAHPSTWVIHLTQRIHQLNLNEGQQQSSLNMFFLNKDLSRLPSSNRHHLKHGMQINFRII